MLLKRISAVLCTSSLLLVAPIQAEERIDLSTLHRIKDEAFQNSKEMENEFYLTDVYGPRLTGSPGYYSAADWVVKKMKECGINDHKEKSGHIDPRWVSTTSSTH